MAKCDPQKKKNAIGKAEEILRSVLAKDPLHACAIQVLGDLLEAGLISLIQIQTISDPDRYTAVSGGSMHFLCFRSRKKKKRKIRI